MRHLYAMLFVGVTMLALLAGCSSGTITTGNVAATNTTAAAPTETATTATSVSATATSSSHPSATHTPTSHPPTQTPTSTIKNCGVVTSNGTTTTPSNPQPDEDCFTQAFMSCQPAKFEINVTDTTGTTDDKMSTQQGCSGASVTEHKHSSSMDTTATFTCNAMVPSGQKYSLRECTNDEWIFFP